MERARRAAHRLAERVGSELELPVLLYGELGAGHRPAFYRLGGPEELQRRIAAGELVPDFGPSELHPRAGAVLVGARAPLVAFNAVLATDDVTVAAEVARAVRESSGGMPGVQALGFRLASTGRAQVSVNVIDVERASLHDVVERIRAEAQERGVDVDGCELVGLLPARAVVEAAAAPLGLPGLDASRVVELRLLG
jgi:glutamate formiminotransferase